MRCFLAFLVLMYAFVAHAQGPDDKWLAQGLAAYERVNVTKNPRKGDADDSMMVIGFIGGVVSVNRANNFAAGLMGDKGNETNKRIIRTFTPLRGLPKNVTVEAIVSLTRSWMAAHPDQLGQGADGIITSALQEAYPK